MDQNDQSSNPNTTRTLSENQTSEYTQPEQPAQNTTPATDPTSAQQNPPAHNPGETLGIISIIMTIPLGLSLVGLILGVISKRRSKEAGASTTLGTVGIILGAIGTALATLAIIAFIALFAIAASQGNTDSNDSFEYESNSSSSL